MSVRKKWLRSEANIVEALRLYWSKEAPTLESISQKLDTSISTISWALSQRISSAEYAALKKLRYSRSKMGIKNPCFGKRGS